jgi:hemerythrin-like domain-containing protein
MTKKPKFNVESIFDQLKKDHIEVMDMLNEMLDNMEPSEDTFFEIKKALDVHMKGEEKLFYPALKRLGDEAVFLVNEALVEHNIAKELINSLSETKVDDEFWLPKLKVLADTLNHHIEEEEGEIFDAAKAELDDNQIIDISTKFSELKSEQVAA